MKLLILTFFVYFCLAHVSNDEFEILKSLTVTVLRLISYFISGGICFMKVSEPLVHKLFRILFQPAELFL